MIYQNSLNFGKSMRWGSRTDSFIRPIRNLSVILGEEIVDAEFLVLNHQIFHLHIEWFL